MATAARGKAPNSLNSRKGRTAPTVQTPTNYLNSNITGDSTSQIRLQWLRARAAVSPSLATTVANLAWEVRHG